MNTLLVSVQSSKQSVIHGFDVNSFLVDLFLSSFDNAYFQLKRISSVRRFLAEGAASALVSSYILSRLDYCNCLLMGTPNSVIQPSLQDSYSWHPVTTT